MIDSNFNNMKNNSEYISCQSACDWKACYSLLSHFDRS